jgi:hypothetical protein
VATAAKELKTSAGTRPESRARGRLRFHFAIALILVGSMVSGFYFDLPKYVLHRTLHFPAVLAVHSAVFSAWMLLYLTQTLLVQTRNVRVHRTLGWFGLVLAGVMPPLGIATAIVMRRFDLLNIPSQNVPLDLAFLAGPLGDIIAFTSCAWLGIALRKRRDYHSRLMFLSIASVADTGFSRIPIPGGGKWVYLCNLTFYIAGIAHDRKTLGHVHKVFLWGVPLLLLNEAFAAYLWQAHPHWWLAVCSSLVGVG